MALRSFDKVGGVPTHYDRDPAPNNYGTKGRPASFRAEASFITTLDKAFKELWDVCPLGEAKIVTSAGAFVNHGGGGHHPRGTAFDLDGIFWQNKDFVTLFDGFNGRDRPFYYGVECVMRKHFGTVLNFDFNAAHRDHFHLDIGGTVGFSSSALSEVLFLQGLLVRVFRQNIGITGIDGDFGVNTQAALDRVLATLGVTGSITTKAKWLDFLTKSASVAFGLTATDAARDTTPLDLLHSHYSLIANELREHPARLQVEASLNNFANDPKVQTFLDGFR
jgi:Extensin-like protein C-terminus